MKRARPFETEEEFMKWYDGISSEKEIERKVLKDGKIRLIVKTLEFEFGYHIEGN